MRRRMRLIEIAIVLFIEQNDMKRKRQKSNDDAALNYFKQSPGHHIDRKSKRFKHF